MEEEKLLRILKLIIILTIFLAETCKANDDLKWARGLSDSAVNEVWEHLNAKFNEQNKLEGSESNNSFSSKLYVFVSSSMPLPLLKTYAHEALKYNATLVFKSLPNGSFKSLAELMVQLKDAGGDVANASIDDEAFELFSISSVPTVVLTEEHAYHPNQTSTLR